MNITRIRHNWPEPAGFELKRPNGAGEYIFLHFLTPVEMYVDGTWHQLPIGSFIIFAPETPQHFICSKPLLHDWMHISGDVKNELSRFEIRTDTIYQATQSDQVTQRIARLEAELLARSRHFEICVESVLSDLWATLSRQIAGEVPKPVLRETADMLRSLRADMILHPEWAWTHEMMAQQVNISPSRLYALYRRQFHISPGRDLILLRIERAKTILNQGISVNKTAELLGYASNFHFIRQFKQETGITPGKWLSS